MTKYFEDFAVGTEFESRSIIESLSTKYGALLSSGILGPIIWTRSERKRPLIGQLFAPDVLAHETEYYTVAPDPEVAMGQGRSLFRVSDLLEPASLVARLSQGEGW
jgi:hypothetical protein